MICTPQWCVRIVLANHNHTRTAHKRIYTKHTRTCTRKHIHTRAHVRTSTQAHTRTCARICNEWHFLCVHECVCIASWWCVAFFRFLAAGGPQLRIRYTRVGAWLYLFSLLGRNSYYPVLVSCLLGLNDRFILFLNDFFIDFSILSRCNDSFLSSSHLCIFFLLLLLLLLHTVAWACTEAELATSEVIALAVFARHGGKLLYSNTFHTRTHFTYYYDKPTPLAYTVWCTAYCLMTAPLCASINK